MTPPEFDFEAHERRVAERVVELQKKAARVALFDELIDLYHDGLCSFEEAVDQFLHDAERDGCGYDQIREAA